MTILLFEPPARADEIDEAAQLIDETIAAVSDDRAIPERMPKSRRATARGPGREPPRRRDDQDASGPLSATLGRSRIITSEMVLAEVLNDPRLFTEWRTPHDRLAEPTW
ncbi:MAG: hypothetical protein ACXW5U_08115 [Thermoanaerobaculia bacterium]